MIQKTGYKLHRNTLVLLITAIDGETGIKYRFTYDYTDADNYKYKRLLWDPHNSSCYQEHPNFSAYTADAHRLIREYGTVLLTNDKDYF